MDRVFVVAVHKDCYCDAGENDVRPDGFFEIQKREREPEEKKKRGEANFDAEHKENSEEEFDAERTKNDKGRIEGEIIGEVVADDRVNCELRVEEFCVHRSEYQRNAKCDTQDEEGVLFEPFDVPMDMCRIEMVEFCIEREDSIADEECSDHLAEIICIREHIETVVLPHQKIRDDKCDRNYTCAKTCHS